jgi:predicted O-linked N-acetylglucosamine transferase (SPINDLY family)
MEEISLDQAMALAGKHYQAGQLHDAETLYRQILAKHPEQPDALHILGLIGYQAGRLDAAAELISRAITLRPIADFYGNLGLVLAAQKKYGPAIEAYRTALAKKPQYPEALSNLGNALQETGQPLEAIKLYRQALQLQPGFSKAYNGLGNSYQMIGRLDDAITCFREALALTPDAAELHNNLGNAYYMKAQWDNAIDSYRRAMHFRYDYADVHYNLGNALQLKGMPGPAINAYRQALALRPDYPEAYNNLGNAMRRDSRLDEAIDCYRAALRLRPDFADAHNNLGSTLKDHGELDDAIACFDRAIQLRPESSAMASNRCYTLTFSPRYDDAALFAEHRKWNQTFAASLKSTIRPHNNSRQENRRLRIGYVSPDFRNHVVGQNLLPLFREHDRQKFEIFCYANVLKPDAVTAQFESHCDHWRNILSVSDEKAAEMIRQDKIDILVDLALHMANNRLLLFARKPAPVQATFGGYPGTTGLETMDFRLTDPYLDPPGLDDSPSAGRAYSEQSIRLQDSFWCYDPQAMDVADAPPAGPLPAQTSGHVTFGCMSNFCKVNDGVLELWARVLKSVANSRLLLLAPLGRPRQRVLETLGAQGIDAPRIQFEAYQPRKQYLLSYQRIDLGLDALPYNGHTTSLDSFWMGVPVISLIGKTVVGRAGFSQLCNLGLREFAAKTPDQFVEIATHAATDLPRLAELRAGLRDRMKQSPLADAARFARSIEAAYVQMWRK